MPTSSKNLTLDFMQTEKGQKASYKLNAILGLKYNHENPFSHNFLVQFQNIHTKFAETVEISPELLRYKFKLGHTYRRGKLYSKEQEECTDFIQINTNTMVEQFPIYRILSEKATQYILGGNDFHSYKYRGNFCYVHKEGNRRYIIPTSVIALHYYFRSSSMKEAVFKGNPNTLHAKDKSNLIDKNDAIIFLDPKAAKLDGPFIYRFLSSHEAYKGFVDLFRYISSVKSKNDFNAKYTSLIPMKSLFPTKEIFNIKARYIELPKEENSDIQTFLINEIVNDDSTLDFENLTVLKSKKKDELVDPSEEGLHVKGRKPRKKRPNVNTKTPATIYGTNKIREIENNQNLSLANKNVTYDSVEEEGSKIPFVTEEEQKGTVSVSFSRGKDKGDETAQQSKLEETKDEEKEIISKPPSFDIFLESLEFVEYSGLVSNFEFTGEYTDIPKGYTKNGNLSDKCLIHNRLKQYVTCSFEFNDKKAILLEVESEKADFATWVLSSNTTILDERIHDILQSRYTQHSTIQSLKENFNNLDVIKFNTHKHASVNDQNEHEEVLERWLLRLLHKLK